MRFLIVNADDFGQSPGINQGIARAHRDGILTSATIMANGDAFDQAVEIALQTPSLGVGVHLNLVEGRPVASGGVSSLVDRRGEFLGKWGLIQRHLNGKLRLDDVRREALAQIQKVVDAGIVPTHLDGHQHLHVYPPFAAAIVDVVTKMEIPSIRLPDERWRWGDLRFSKTGVLRTTAINFATRVSRRHVKRSELKSPDRFAGTLLTGGVSADWLLEWLPQISEGVTELMTHPGLTADENLKSRLETREGELSAIIDPEVAKAVAESRIQLVHYGHFNRPRQ